MFFLFSWENLGPPWPLRVPGGSPVSPALSSMSFMDSAGIWVHPRQCHRDWYEL